MKWFKKRFMDWMNSSEGWFAELVRRWHWDKMIKRLRGL